jgi:nucleoside-diphosphate-sugar epimerase
MIIGSGVVASCLDDRPGVILYAAGVSNSRCEDADEFKRDRERLIDNLDRRGLFVYFSTCAAGDSTYVTHKRELEALVKERGDYLICRLPIVAGKTTNPHTLLNYLHSRIARSERFDLIPEARRNIIDTTDIGSIVKWLLKTGAENETVNVAAPMDYSMRQIVTAFEDLTGKRAYTRDHPGSPDLLIDVSRIKAAPMCWSGDYLGDVLRRYYG